MVKDLHCTRLSLRAGTLILLWGFSIQNIISFIQTLEENIRILQNIDVNSVVNFFYYYSMTWPIFGIIVSFLGILAIAKNKAHLLNGIFWYLLCNIIIDVMIVVLLLVRISIKVLYGHPNQQKNYVITPSWNISVTAFYALYLAGLVFLIAFFTYFAWIVKRCQDEMRKNNYRTFIGTFKS